MYAKNAKTANNIFGPARAGIKNAPPETPAKNALKSQCFLTAKNGMIPAAPKNKIGRASCRERV